MGDKDIIKITLEKLQNEKDPDFLVDIKFGRVNIKPGKPMTFTTVQINGQQKLIVSLPGNPVSATGLVGAPWRTSLNPSRGSRRSRGARRSQGACRFNRVHAYVLIW